MAEKINAYCSICGKGYHMCISCKDQMKLNPWKRHTDTAEHFKIYQVIHGYNTGIYKKSEAKAKLKRIDLSDIDVLKENIRQIINDIMGDVEPVADKKPVVVQEPVVKVEETAKAEPVVKPVIADKQELVEKTVKQTKFLCNDSVK